MIRIAVICALALLSIVSVASAQTCQASPVAVQILGSGGPGRTPIARRPATFCGLAIGQGFSSTLAAGRSGRGPVQFSSPCCFREVSIHCFVGENLTLGNKRHEHARNKQPLALEIMASSRRAGLVEVVLPTTKERESGHKEPTPAQVAQNE